MKKPNLLVIEDDKVDAMLIQRALTEINCPLKIDRAENGVKGMQLLMEASEKICYILLDLNMPYMNGFEFMKRKNTVEKLKDIPVIVFSTSNNEEDKQLSFELGAIDYLIKPLDYQEYKQTLTKINWSPCV